mgnify:CR=1 FL=1
MLTGSERYLDHAEHALAEPRYKKRLIQLADNIVDHLVASMDDPRVRLGFAEEYNADWTLRADSTEHSVGHILKTAWCLGQIYMIQPDPRYKAAARRRLHAVWDQGLYDREYGGPFSNFDWAKGTITDTQKDYWMLEQGAKAGIVNYFLKPAAVGANIAE